MLDSGKILNFFIENYVFVITVLGEFHPVNCPGKMSPDEFKNHLGNMKYFLLKGKLDSRSNLCNIQQSYFRKNKINWDVQCLTQAFGVTILIVTQ